MARHASRLVVASKLETEFLTGCVKHRSSTTEEIWDVQSEIGKGTFGVVRIERCRVSTLHPSSSSRNPLRAVKVIKKPDAAGQSWDYMKELEAIAQFSSQQYAPYFVRSYGWFENDVSIFIAMEYLSLGDLRRFMDAQPQFSEDATQQIVRQLLKGIRFMHASSFAHRDLKPGNILVSSYSPRWVVKIADFGISKQSMEGITHLQTHVGTVGYMAPEVFDANNSYSVSVDIWAIGIITIELLIKQHPLPNLSDVFKLVHGVSPLITDTETGLFLSEACRDFVRGLLNTNSVTRPTANAALAHPWLEEVIPDSDEEESLFVTDDPPPRSSMPSRYQDAATPISLPSLAWSNSQSINTPIGTYNGPALDSRLLLPNLQGFSLETNKYFVLRSDNPTDIETSVAHSVWTSSSRVNKILDKAWKKTDGQVILFFSVIQSQRFCGIAQMTSGMDWETTDEHWVDDSWKGRFTLNWLCLTELPFAGVRHVPVSSRTPGFRAIACYDGTEISAPSAFELLQAYSTREREGASQLLSPPATITPSNFDTLSSSTSSGLTRRVQHLALNLTSRPDERRRGDGVHRTTSSLEFNNILRPQV
ncbi:kinase-like protein [Nemania diffusa]|nr:kinase-like protein [Nemania diffusa]